MIPISTALRVANDHEYDQIVILGRRVGESGQEHVTTAGRTTEHCRVAARMGDYLKHRVMGWPELEQIDELRQSLSATEANLAQMQGEAAVMRDLLRTAVSMVDSFNDEDHDHPEEIQRYREALVAAIDAVAATEEPNGGKRLLALKGAFPHIELDDSGWDDEAAGEIEFLDRQNHELRTRITRANGEMNTECAQRRAINPAGCEPWNVCPTCPRRYLIELPDQP